VASTKLTVDAITTETLTLKLDQIGGVELSAVGPQKGLPKIAHDE
jgi:hypothetical protein